MNFENDFTTVVKVSDTAHWVSCLNSDYLARLTTSQPAHVKV